MKSTNFIILLLLFFTFSISTGAARACCWGLEKSAERTVQVKSESEHEPCHTKNENSKMDSENKSQESNDCCYDMIECQIQAIKISKSVAISPSHYKLIQLDLINDFISNTVEPLKHPPKVLL